MTTLRAGVADVVARGACSGCGLCTMLDRGLDMRLNAAGHLRPMPTRDPQELPNAAALFERGCPGRVVTAPPLPAGGTRHPLLGVYIDAWEAWATDAEIRHAGSSGGALTALHTWLVESGRSARVAGAAGDLKAPRSSVPVTITTRAEALAAAGSRYAPVGALANEAITQPGTAVTAKPCEASALRAVGAAVAGGEAPLVLSFFCAGTPSQDATDTLLEELGIPATAPVDALWYRGHGWPGSFTAASGETIVTADYEESWGRVLGPTTQWRCKICVDGVGEDADIVSADSWATDERGYPVFSEGDGVSALIARTERGSQVIRAAITAGVIGVRPLDMDHLADAQPLQTNRRRFLLARLLGARLAGRIPPRYRGYRFLALGLREPRTFLRVLRGTYRRVRGAHGTL